MKNSQTVSAYLNHVQNRIGEPFDVWLEWHQRATDLWSAALADGWTIDELDAACVRRLGYDPAKIAAWRASLKEPRE